MTATVIRVGRGTWLKPSYMIVGDIIMALDLIKSIHDSEP